MGDSHEDIYRDVLRKHHGDHLKAQEAFQELGLPLPPHAPRSQNGASTRYHNIVPEVAPASGTAGRAVPRTSQANASPGFLCPLTGIIMRDPVVLNATLISFEREAITWWLQAHPGQCPVTRRPVDDPSVAPDDELRLSITNWAARYAPHLMSTSQDGTLQAAVFPDGVDAAIARHQAAAAPAPSAPPAAPPPPQHLQNPGGAPSSRGLRGGATPLLARRASEEAQLHSDREFALRIAHEPSAELPPAVATAPPHDRVLADRLQRARHRGRASYPYVSPAFFLALLAGFIFSMSKNGWGLVDASANPWLGVDSDALRAAGGACSSCIIQGDGWRILSALFVPAGLIHLVSVSFLISASSSVCARAGLPPVEFIACILVGGVIGSMTSAVAAPRTIHSTAGALGAAAVSAAIASILSVRRHVVTYGPLLVLTVFWLAAMLVSCLAPFVDTWAAAAGGLAGGICAAAFMAPYASMTSSRSGERLVIAWQVTLTALVVAAGVSVLAGVLSMPRVGYKCSLCDTLTCQSFFGWNCAAAANRAGFCEIQVFPDSSAVLVCPSQEEVAIAAVRGAFDTIDVDAECDARCGGSMPSAPSPPAGPPSDGGDVDGGDGGGGGDDTSPGTPPPAGSGPPDPVEEPGDEGGGGDGSGGDGSPGEGGAQFIDPTVGSNPDGDDIGATSR